MGPGHLCHLGVSLRGITVKCQLKCVLCRHHFLLAHLLLVDMSACHIQGGATLASVDRWCAGTYPVTKHLPYSGWVIASLPPFLWRRRVVEYVWHFWTPVCHIRRRYCHVLHWQDSEETVKYSTKSVCCITSVFVIVVKILSLIKSLINNNVSPVWFSVIFILIYFLVLVLVSF